MKEKYPRNKKIKSADDGEEQPVVEPPKLKEIFDFSVLKDSTFVLWMIASMISTLGNFVPFFFLPSKPFSFHLYTKNIILNWIRRVTNTNILPASLWTAYATYHNLSTADGTAFMAVLAGSNCIGRVTLG